MIGKYSIILLLSILFGNTEAITKDGKSVLLKSDGTWEFIEDIDTNINSDFKFRKSYWGDSKSKVSSVETSTPLPMPNNPDILAYTGEVGGLSTLIGYYFVDNMLYRGGYIFQEEHSNKNIFMADYVQIKTILEDKYGEGEEKINWSNDLYADDSSQYGFAISLGHLSMSTEWVVNDTEISLELYGDNYKITHRITYTNEQLKEAARQKKREVNSSDF